MGDERWRSEGIRSRRNLHGERGDYALSVLDGEHVHGDLQARSVWKRIAADGDKDARSVFIAEGRDVHS